MATLRKIRWNCGASLLLLAALLAGCNRSDSALNATVQGTVTIDGELATRGTVVFHPVGDGPQAYGSIFKDGAYSLRVGQGRLSDPDGGRLQAGEYIVTVVVTAPSIKSKAGDSGPPTPGPRITAAKYADRETSDKKVTVKAGGNVIPIDVPRATEEELAETAAAEAAAKAAAQPAGGANVEEGAVDGAEGKKDEGKATAIDGANAPQGDAAPEGHAPVGESTPSRGEGGEAKP